MRGWQLATVAAIAGFLTMFLVWANAVRSQSTCEVVRDQVRRSLAATGQPGTPGYSYYQEHPAELEAARASAQQLLDKLPC